MLFWFHQDKQDGKDEVPQAHYWLCVPEAFGAANKVGQMKRNGIGDI